MKRFAHSEAETPPDLTRDTAAARRLTQVLQRLQDGGQVPVPQEAAERQRRPPAEPVLLAGRPVDDVQAAPYGPDLGTVVILPPGIASPQRLQEMTPANLRLRPTSF